MGFFGRLLGREAKSASSSLELFREVYGDWRKSASGAVVNVDTALAVTTVLACCRVLAEGVSQVPFKVLRKTSKGGVVAEDHPLHELISLRPNRWQTSFEFRETLMFHTALTTNAYVFTNRVGLDRKIKELIPIEPRRVQVKQLKDYSLQYTITADDGTTQVFGQDAIWHLRGPSWNSWLGMEALRLTRNAIGLAVSLEQGQAEFQKNGAQQSGVHAVEGKLSPAEFEQLSAWLDRYKIGGDMYGKPLVLDRAAEYTPMGMSGADQELLATRKHQVEEICRGFRVMPIMVGQSDKAATYASAEQMFLAHVVHTLSPWYVRIESSADVNLLSPADRAAGLYTKFLPNALMRGAAKDRADFYAKALGSGGTKGWMTQNDVRRLEDLELSEEPEANQLPQPTSRSPQPNPTPREDE